MDFSGNRILTEVTYSNYKRFDTDINFGTVVDNTEAPFSDSISHPQMWNLNFAVFPYGQSADSPETSVEPVKEAATIHSDKDIFSAIKERTSKLYVQYWEEQNTRRWRLCTVSVYDVVDKQVFFLTDKHCFKGAVINARLIDKKKPELAVYPKNIMLLDSDVAVIKVTTDKKEWLSSDVNFSFSHPELTDSVFTAGFPKDSYNETSGIWYDTHNISVNENINIAGALSAKIQLEIGASGSSGYNRNLQFVGLVTSIGYLDTKNIIRTDKCKECTSLSFFISGEEIYRLLKRYRLISR